MKADSTGRITLLLNSVREGGDAAVEDLVGFVYSEMRRIAGNLLNKENRGHTLRATDIVHEAYLRLFDRDALDWKDREHFFASAAMAMRRVLIDHARRKKAGKRIPKDEMISLEVAPEPWQSPDLDLLALDQALDRLAAIDARQARIVELRYFAGLTGDEVAEIMNISRMTVIREWRAARLWLHREMKS